MKKLFGILIFSALTFNLVAQEFEVPQNCVFTTKDDYSKYEKDVLNGIDWLLKTPVNLQTDKRKDVNTFLLKWVIGSPYLTIDIKTEVVSFMKPNADLLTIYMCGWAKYSLETKDYNNKIKGSQKGIEAVIEFYIKNKENLKKDKNVEKYIKLKEEGKLEDYISKNA